MKKLSSAQIKVLRALAEGGKAYFVTGIDAHWFLTIRDGRVRFLTMEALIGLNLVDLKKDALGRCQSAIITPAGRQYLAELEGKEDA